MRKFKAYFAVTAFYHRSYKIIFNAKHDLICRLLYEGRTLSMKYVSKFFYKYYFVAFLRKPVVLSICFGYGEILQLNKVFGSCKFMYLQCKCKENFKVFFKVVFFVVRSEKGQAKAEKQKKIV